MKTVKWIPQIVDDGQPDVYIREVRDVYRWMRDMGFRDAPKENLVALLLDEERRVIGHEVVATGSRDTTLAPLKESFCAAVQLRAAHLLICHNHPPGDPRPSKADAKTTAHFGVLGQICDIDLFDHVIVAAGSDEYYSFRKEEILKDEEE